MRMDAFIRETRCQTPDIVCIQEMTKGMVNMMMMKEMWDTYTISPYPCDAPYFTVILVHKIHKEIRFERLPIPSNMHRDLLLVHVNDMVVGTVHLESLNNARIRSMQVHVISDYLKQYNKVVLAGDFNIWDGGEVLTRYLPEYCDDGKGNTFGKYRPDRILVKGVKGQNIRKVYYCVFSDHKGLRINII